MVISSSVDHPSQYNLVVPVGIPQWKGWVFANSVRLPQLGDRHAQEYKHQQTSMISNIIEGCTKPKLQSARSRKLVLDEHHAEQSKDRRPKTKSSQESSDSRAIWHPTPEGTGESSNLLAPGPVLTARGGATPITKEPYQAHTTYLERA